MAPLLSIIIPARNDNFMGSFRYRLETTLNYLARNLERVGRLANTEIVIADWGSQVPLYRDLVLSSAAQQITRYVIVPPVVAIPAQGDSEFPIVIAQNTVIRRSHGEFIMQTDSDVLFTEQFLVRLFDLLEGKYSHLVPVTQALVSSKRRQIPWEFIASSPPLEAYDALILSEGDRMHMDGDSGFGFCTTGMMFMHRSVWHECSGYDEQLIHWGWMEIDLGFRVTKKYPWFDVTNNLGMVMYHMEHYRSLSTERKVSRKMNPTEKPVHIRANGEEWGLASLQLEEYNYRGNRLSENDLASAAIGLMR